MVFALLLGRANGSSRRWAARIVPVLHAFLEESTARLALQSLLIRTERAGRHFLLLKESPSASPPAFAIPTFRTVSPAVDKTSTMLFGFANHALMVSTYTSGISWIATFRSTRLMVSEWSIPARC
jgi:hypothetical protein